MEQDIKDRFIHLFKKYCKERDIECPELTEDIIRESVDRFLEFEKLTPARDYIHHIVNEYVEGDNLYPDWRLPREELEQTYEYKVFRRFHDINGAWYDTCRNLEMDKEWAKVHGKCHTDEEAAKIVADKWCSLIFKFHLQDNGALNETSSFNMCALGTLLAEKCREGITEDIVEKTHNLFYEYYLRKLRFDRGYNDEDISWLVKNLPDNNEKDPFDWTRYGFAINLYCDYGPGTPLYLILLNGGVPERDIHNICPWKTGITIRPEDNTVMYQTYGHMDEL